MFTQYRQTDFYKQTDPRLIFDNEETGQGDSSYVGNSKTTVGCKQLLQPISPGEIAALPAGDRELAHQFNTSKQIVRTG